MRLAIAFGRLDVDRMLGEIDHEQFCEWNDFLALEPHGWEALRIAVTRLSYMTAQSRSPKRLRERDFDLKLGANIHSPTTDRARWEAMGVRSEIAERMKMNG